MDIYVFVSDFKFSEISSQAESEEASWFKLCLQTKVGRYAGCRRGARAASVHCQGTLERGAGAPHAQIGPCDGPGMDAFTWMELGEAPGPSPWPRKGKKAVKKKKYLQLSVNCPIMISGFIKWLFEIYSINWVCKAIKWDGSLLYLWINVLIFVLFWKQFRLRIDSCSCQCNYPNEGWNTFHPDGVCSASRSICPAVLTFYVLRLAPQLWWHVYTHN